MFTREKKDAATHSTYSPYKVIQTKNNGPEPRKTRQKNQGFNQI